MGSSGQRDPFRYRVPRGSGGRSHGRSNGKRQTQPDCPVHGGNAWPYREGNRGPGRRPSAVPLGKYSEKSSGNLFFARTMIIDRYGAYDRSGVIPRYPRPLSRRARRGHRYPQPVRLVWKDGTIIPVFILWRARFFPAFHFRQNPHVPGHSLPHAPTLPSARTAGALCGIPALPARSFRH